MACAMNIVLAYPDLAKPNQYNLTHRSWRGVPRIISSLAPLPSES
jgi:hypothetical protein